MTLLWPEMLWLLLLIPAVVGVYILVLRRKRKTALRYASLALIRDALSAGQRFRRHVPPLLFALALVLLLFAIARPAAIVTLPSQHETVILAMDVSGSMRATDVENHAHRRRDVRCDGGGRAIADAQPRGHRRGDR